MSKIRCENVENFNKALKNLEYVLNNDPELQLEGIPTEIKDLEMEFDVFIRELPEKYFISFVPLSGEGHDYMFYIIKKNNNVEALSIGEIEPDPDEALE